MNGTDLDLPLASRAELDLQRRLARCRRHYAGNALQARLDIAQAAPDVDLELSLAWDGLPLRFLCQAPALAHWLAPNLQEAAFASLPAALQLALLEREGNVFPGLVWYGLSPAQPRAAMGLRLSLERDDQRLALWLDGDPATLLARLPPRPSAQRLAIPLRLSLQWPGLPLDASELRTLEPGDLLLLPAGHRPDAALLGVSKDAPGRAANSTPRNWNCSTCTTPPPSPTARTCTNSTNCRSRSASRSAAAPWTCIPSPPCSQARCSISTVPWTAKCASSPTSAASVSANWSGSRIGWGARNPPVRTRRSMIQLPDELGLILGLALLALVPFIAVMATSFIKMTVVFSLLRNALGVQQIPPNMAMYGLAIILSLYVMAPVGFATRDYLRNHDVSLSDSASVERFLDEGMAPYRNFLKRQIQEREHTFFMESTRQVWPSEYAERLDPDSLLILLPAFTVSELTRAFEIGFLIYLPFIAIDLIISNILLAMGMMMVSPMTISLPFKLLLFVLLDGWARLTHGLVISYGG